MMKRRTHLLQFPVMRWVNLLKQHVTRINIYCLWSQNNVTTKVVN